MNGKNRVKFPVFYLAQLSRTQHRGPFSRSPCVKASAIGEAEGSNAKRNKRLSRLSAISSVVPGAECVPILVYR
jgi:hypothetical protein